MLKITYGTSAKNIDVTEAVYAKCASKVGFFTIPSGDEERAKLFGDPVFRTLKSIFVTTASGTTEFDHTKSVTVSADKSAAYTPTDKLAEFHKVLTLKYGGFHDELPEQRMVSRYLSGNEKVLEIGGNIGRVSLIIASILKENQNQYVCMECNDDIANRLKENRDANGFTFHIETAALSNKKLIQKGWDTLNKTYISDELLPGYKEVKTITWKDFTAKYNIPFDTLVLDCEGAFYYMLEDMPEMLDGLRTVIMENDYRDNTHKQFVDATMKEKGFVVDFSQSGGWGPCQANFFEVWVRS